MKKKSLALLMLVAILASMLVLVVTACDKRNGVWPEAGTYYFDAKDGSEYTLTLEKGKRYTLVTNTTKSGKYTVDNGTDVITITMEDGKNTITAVYRDSERSVTINDNKYLEKIDYTITLIMNGGTNPAPITLRNGRKLNQPKTPTRAGYLFAGWYEKDNYKTEYVFGLPINDDLTIYGRWVQDIKTPPEFSVAFDLNYQTDKTIATVETTGHMIYFLETPQREGYTFGDWWISQYDDGSKLSYPFDKNKEIEENLTLYALWISDADISPKLKAPVVRIVGDEVRWNTIQNATTYDITLENNDGLIEEYCRTNVVAGFFTIRFSQLPPDDYIIRVIAKSNIPTNNSDEGVAYYRNKALTRVSFFEVDDDNSLFKFNSVGATSYTVDIVCGDQLHTGGHITKVLSDTERVVDFSDCVMPQDGGIIFIVTARKNGYYDSVAQFEYQRVLDKVNKASINVVADTNLLQWDAVKNATSYIIDIVCGDETHRHTHQNLNIGNKTSYSLAECSPLDGGIIIKIIPVSKSWQSPVVTESDAYEFNKTILAAPRNITLEDNKLVWDSVPKAELYEIFIDGNLVDSVTINQFELEASLLGQSPTAIKIRATKATGAADYASTKSLFSQEFLISTQLMDASYNQGYLYWSAVLSADSYEIQINDAAPFEVSGVSSPIELSQAGSNSISITPVMDGTRLQSKTITVFAYTVTYIVGDTEQTEFKAQGDKITRTATVQGASFAGWWSSADANGIRFDTDLFEVSKDITMYARFMAGKFTVTLDYGDPLNTTDRQESAQVKGGESFNLPALYVKYNTNKTILDDGKSFVGWYTLGGQRMTDELGKSIAPWNLNSDVTLIAKWERILDFTRGTNPAGYAEYSISRPTFATVERSWFNIVSHLYVPATVDGIPIARLNGWALDNCNNLITIQLPNTINTAMVSAFSRCYSLREVSLYEVPGNRDIMFEVVNGALLEIKERNQQGVAISYGIVVYPAARVGALDIPSGVESIAEGVFRGNRNITAIKIPQTVKEIAAYAFENCTSLTTVEFMGGDSNPIKTIGTNMFANCSSLKSVILPGSLAVIGNNAFSYSGLESIDIPNTVKNILPSAFFACRNLETVNFEKDGTEPLLIGLASIASHIPMTSVFSGCTSLKSIEIPARTQVIGNFAFNGCISLTSLLFESSESANQNATELRIGTQGVTSVFKGTNLVDITLPAHTTFIGEQAFAEIPTLDTVGFAPYKSGVVLDLKNSAFINSGIKVFTIPRAVAPQTLNISAQANGLFYGCNRLSNIFIETGYTGYNIKENGLYSQDNKEILFVPIAASEFYSILDGVTKIGARVFENHANITSLYIPDTVTEIGEFAFSGMRIAELNLPTNVEFTTIGNNALSNMSRLTSIVIPSSVVSIGNNAFLGCDSLVSVTLSDNLTTIGKSAFEKTALSALTIPAKVVSIGASAFKDTKIANLTFEKAGSGLGENLLIGSFAFQNTNIDVLEIPARVITVKDVFADSQKLTKVTFEAGNDLLTTDITNAFSNTPMLEEVNLPIRLNSIGTAAFMNSGIKKLVIEKNVSSIAIDAFIGASRLQSITVSALNQDYISVGGSLFTKDSQSSHDTLLVYAGADSTYEIPAGTKNIEKNAFDGRLHLTSIIVATDIETIKAHVFMNIVNLESISFKQGGTKDLTIEGYAFEGSNKLSTVTLPARLKTIQESAFRGLVSLSNVLFDNDDTQRLISIGAHSFRSSGLVQIDLPNSLNTIGDSAFRETAYLTSVTLPQGNTEFKTIASNAFRDSAIESIIIPASVQTINNNAFTNTFGLTAANAVQFESGSILASIGESAFANSAISAVILPNNITSIGKSAFISSGLTQIVLPDSITTLGESVFEGAAQLASVELSGSSSFVALPKNAFKGAISLQDIQIKNNVKTIGESAFEGSAIANITIPASVTAINARAFATTNIVSIEIPDTVLTMGIEVFFDAVLLEEVTLPSNSTYTVIQNAMFKNTVNLKSISIPSQITQIGQSAFENSNLSGKEEVAGIIFEDNLGVTKLATLGNYAFASTKLKAIVLPNTVRSIGEGAFQNTMYLKSVGLPSNSNPFAALAKNLFYGSAIESIFIPVSVKTIGESAFENTPNLIGANAITFGKTATNVTAVTTINDNAFRGSGITSFEIPDTVTKIGEGAFENSKLAYVKLPSNSTYKIIGASTFKNTLLTGTITIPANINTITGGANSGAFSGIPSAFNLVFTPSTESNLTINSYAFFNSNLTGLLNLPSRTKNIPSYAFANTNISGLVIDDGGVNNALTIQEGAFSTISTINNPIANYIVGLSGNVSLPSRLTLVGKDAFNKARLSGVTIKAPFKGSLKSGSFGYITTPFTFEIEDGGEITGWDDQVFFGSSGLTRFKAKLESKIDFLRLSIDTSSQDGTFFEITQNKEADANYPISESDEDGVVYGYYQDTHNKEQSLRSRIVKTIKLANVKGEYTVPEDVVRIGGGAYNKSPNGYNYFNAFKNSGGLTKIYIHKDVNYIYETAFKGCYNLMEFVVDPLNEFFENDDEGVLYTKGGSTLVAFPGGKSGSYRIKDRTTTIKAYAFANGAENHGDKSPENQVSIKIEEVIIPASVTTLGTDTEDVYNMVSPDVFKDAKHLKRVIFEPGGGLTSIPVRTFMGSGVEEILNVPSSVIDIGGKNSSGGRDTIAFRDVLNLKTITFEPNGNLAYMTPFVNCPSLENITLPDSITVLPEAVFAGTNIKNMSLHNGITSLPKDAFKDTRNLETIELPVTLRDEFDQDDGRLIKRAFGVGVFQNSGIKSIEIPQGVQSINESVFSGCDRLENVILPMGLQAIGKQAFMGTTGLKGIKLPNLGGMRNPLTGAMIQEPLADAVFEKSGLVSVTLPFGLLSIPSATFRECADLQYLYIPSTVGSIIGNSFEKCDKLTIYTQLLPSQWNTAANRPVIFNVDVVESADDLYINSINTNPSNIANYSANIMPPTRAGYQFMGWSLTRLNPTIAYTMQTMTQAPANTILYAVWQPL